MVRGRTHFPSLGVRPRTKGRKHILILERIRPFDVEMVYSLAYWWQATNSATVSVVNVWPLDTYGAIPPSIDLDDFDAVILFPRLAYDPVTLGLLDRRLTTPFREYAGVKVLMRQDENLMTQLIEDFVIEHDFDILLTCVPQDQVSVAFPRLANSYVDVHTILTGYVTPDMRAFQRAPYESREFDITYRAYKGGFGGGELVYEKYRIGADAIERFAGSGLNLDISLDPAHRLIGTDWRDRLNNSRCVLATESGSNVFDFDGELYRWAVLFDREHRNSELGHRELYELAREKLTPFEGNVRYAQVSPRHFEAAAFGTMQLMFPGSYSDIFIKDRHYLELERDFANATEIVHAIKDPAIHRQITDRAFDEIVMNPSYWIETALNELNERVDDEIASKRPRRTRGASAEPRRIPRLDFGSATLLQLVSDAATLRHIPYYLDDDLQSCNGTCARLVLESGEPLERSRGGSFPWFGLSLDHWVPSRSFAVHGSSATNEAVERLTTVSSFSRAEILEHLGGYDDAHGSIHAFQSDCRLALKALHAASEWSETGIRYGAVMASDPISLGAAVFLAERHDTDLYLDFEGFVHFLTPLHGWQAFFWESLMAGLVQRFPRCTVTVSSVSTVSRVRAMLGVNPIVVPAAGAGSTGNGDPDGKRWPFLSLAEAGNELDDEVIEGLRGELREWGHPLTRPIVPDISTLKSEVLPRIERSFGLESGRYWNTVRDAVVSFQGGQDMAAPYELLHHALSRFVDARRREQRDAPIAELLDQRRIVILNSLMAVEPQMSVDSAREILNRIRTEDIPITEANRRAAWNLVKQLLVLGDTNQFTELYTVLMASHGDETPATAQANVHGLLNLLAYHWGRRDYPSALPVVDALMAIHDRNPSDTGPLLSANVLARVRVIRDATTSASQAAPEPPSDPPWTKDSASPPEERRSRRFRGFKRQPRR